MLSNDFVEEYERIEKVLTSNNEEFVADENGLLIYTTPLEQGDSIVTDVEFFQGQKPVPANGNIIIDNITLLSTNPDVQNFLPLKLRIGTKQKIEFGNPTFRELSNYKIPSKNVNLQTIENRKYERFREHAFFTQNQEIVIDMVRYPSDNIMYYLTQSGRLFFQDLDDESTEQITLPAGSIVVQLYSNTEQAFYRDTDGTYWDLTNPTVVPPLNILVPEEIFNPNDYLADPVQIATVLTGNSFYYVFRDDPPNNQTQIIQVVKSEGLIYEAPDSKTISDFTDQLRNSVAIYRNSIIVNWNQAGNQIQISRFVSDDIVLEAPFSVPPLSGTILGVFVGGDNLEDPFISLMVFNGTTGVLVWRYFNASTPFRYGEKRFPTTSTVRVRRYRNTIYFYIGETYYFCNNDNGEFTEWKVTDLSPNTPYPKDYTILHVDEGVVAINANDGQGIDLTIRSSVWRSVRPLNEVYSLSYTYDDRAYPYQLTGNRFNFTVVLPNNAPLINLEIFGYILDVRVRYTKAKEIHNPTRRDDRGRFIGDTPKPTPVSTEMETIEEDKPMPPKPLRSRSLDTGMREEARGCVKVDIKGKCIKPRFTRSGNVIGTTEQILGISNLKASDFLDLYSNK